MNPLDKLLLRPLFSVRTFASSRLPDPFAEVFAINVEFVAMAIKKTFVRRKQAFRQNDCVLLMLFSIIDAVKFYLKLR